MYTSGPPEGAACCLLRQAFRSCHDSSKNPASSTCCGPSVTRTTPQSGSIGVGFAIPSNIAKRIAGEIIKTGSASHALLGAMVSDATNSSDAASFTIGAKVQKVTADGAAAKAGIQAGDIITKFNDTEITSAGELTAAVRQLPAGASATVEYTRNGTSTTVKVTLGNANSLTK